MKNSKVVNKLKKALSTRQMVKGYLSIRPSVKVTTEQICNDINAKYNKNYTTREISRHLCNLRVQNIVKDVDTNGVSTKRASATRWAYVPSSKR